MVGFKTSLGHKTANSKSLEVKEKYKVFISSNIRRVLKLLFIVSLFRNMKRICRSSFAQEMYPVLEVYSLKMN